MRNSGKPADEIIAEAEEAIFAIDSRGATSDFVSIGEIVKGLSVQIEDIHHGRGDVKLGIATGFSELDSYTNGFRGGQMIVIAARPSVGKTGIALNMMQNMLNDGKSVAFFSLEMDKESITSRLASSKTEVPLQTILGGYMSNLAHGEVQAMLKRIAGEKFFIDDTPSLTIEEVRHRARKLHRREGIDIVFIDYLQLIKASKGESREREISHISNSVKNMAREMIKVHIKYLRVFSVDL